MPSFQLTPLILGEQRSFLKFFSDGPKREKGQLFLAIDLPDNPGAEDALVEKLWRTLQTTFFNYESDDPYFCFEEALKSVNQIFVQENMKRSTGSIGACHALTGLIQDNLLHFSSCGAACIYLKRGIHLSKISEDGESTSDATFGSISSGELLAHDSFIFSTRPFTFPSVALSEALDQKGAKVISHLKLLSKQKNMMGLVTIALPTSEGPEEKPAEINEETVISSEPLAAIINIPLRQRSGQTIKDFIHRFTKKMNTGKIEHAKKKMKSVAQNIGFRIVRIIKKPHFLSELKQRSVLMALGGVMMLFAIIILVRPIFSGNDSETNRFKDILAQVESNNVEAEKRNLIGEKADAVDLLNKSEIMLKEVEASGFFVNSVSKYRDDINHFRDQVNAIIRVEKPTLLVDLAQKGSVDSLGMIHTQDQKNYVYETRRLFESALNTVQEGLQIDPEESVVAGSELEDFNLLSFITQTGQVVEYSTRNGRFERAKTLDESWKKGLDIKTFNGENIYILDSIAATIWKYRRLRAGYGKSVAYAADPALSNSLSLAIDGDIYALMRDGKIQKYRKGKQIPFEVKDQPSAPLQNPTRIFTLAELNNIYILEPNERRIMVYSKDQNGVAHYQKQYVFATLKPNEIRDFFIDKEEQKMTILTADKVYFNDL